MKKWLNGFCVLLLTLGVCCGTALAASTVTYEGGAEQFVFLPGSDLSGSDLFENFKNVMPGDVLTQQVQVENKSEHEIRLYLRAEAVDEKSRAFLNQLVMTVKCSDKEIFHASAAQKAQMTENTLLGTISPGGSTQLTVELAVPIELGNEYMNAAGTVPWTFLAEEIPVQEESELQSTEESEMQAAEMESKKTNTPVKTGDDTKIGLYAVLCIGALLVLCVGGIRGKRTK